MTSRVTGATPLWMAARVLLGERGDDFFRCRARALKTADPEDIHDLRVASRRLREGFALFAPCYPSREIARLARGVKRVTQLLGAIRNADEALLFFTALADELGAACRGDLDRLLLSFRKERKGELARLTDGLRELVTGRMRARYRRVIAAPALFAPPPGVDPLAPLAGFARVALDARFADVVALVPAARRPGEVEAQHRLRIAIKRYRYRMEILSPLVGQSFPELHAAIKEYQDLLGKMHDLDVFAQLVRESHFAAPTEKAVLAAIATKRGDLFTAFAGKLEAVPIEEIGARVRSTW